AAFVGKRRIEAAGQTESIGGFLREPPGVFAACPIVVVGTSEPIHRGDIHSVTPHIFKRAVVSAVTADFCVAMTFAADEVKGLTLVINAEAAGELDFGPFFYGGVRGFGVGDWNFFGWRK